MREASWSFVPTAKCALSRVGPCHNKSLRAPPPPRLVGLYSDLVCAAATPEYANIWLASGAVSPSSTIFRTKTRRDIFPALTSAMRLRKCRSFMVLLPVVVPRRYLRCRISRRHRVWMLAEENGEEHRLFAASPWAPLRRLAGSRLPAKVATNARDDDWRPRRGRG